MTTDKPLSDKIVSLDVIPEELEFDETEIEMRLIKVKDVREAVKKLKVAQNHVLIQILMERSDIPCQAMSQLIDEIFGSELLE